MIEVRTTISPEQADILEGHFCEDYQEHWYLHEDTKTRVHQLRGYFESLDEFKTCLAELEKSIGELKGDWESKDVVDSDWKEAYKIHFKPWSERGLHWVPVWEKDHYQLPEGDEIVLLDPGMAFGTGNHETTRLCALRLLDARDAWGKSNVADKTVIDAGCGSGILAISAKKLHFGDTYAFDNDPDSVRISLDNEKLCSIENSITFEWTDLKEGLKNRKADLVMVNILANVLCDHAELIVDSVKDGGFLALSGILAKEVQEVHQVFAKVIKNRRNLNLSMDSRIDGDWADLSYQFA